MSPLGPSRHIAPPRELGRFRVEADSQWHARSALSVGNDGADLTLMEAQLVRVRRPYLNLTPNIRSPHLVRPGWNAVAPNPVFHTMHGMLKYLAIGERQ